MNYYEILGVAETASADEIKRAYRKLASQHHPDKGGDVSQFQNIQVAYDTLSDPGRRQQYDLERKGMGGQNIRFHWHNGDGSAPDISEIFRNFGFGFENDPFAAFRPQQRRNKDLRIEIPVPLVTTLEQQTKTVSVATTNGERTTVEVTIPRGVTSHTTIKYAGLGDNLFTSLPRGDLYVQINVYPAENFLVQGIDLYTRASVNCLQAITGGSIFVNGLDNKTFEVHIPPGTQAGTKFRIPGQGLYQMNTEQRGNLYVDISLTVPKDLTKEQLEIIKNLLNTQ